jgi:RNA recognition motif-containing protein
LKNRSVPLPSSLVTEVDLQDIFEQFGSITETKLVTDRDTGQPRGFAFVTMSSIPEGRAAIKGLDGKEFGGRRLKVSEARPKATLVTSTPITAISKVEPYVTWRPPLRATLKEYHFNRDGNRPIS